MASISEIVAKAKGAGPYTIESENHLLGTRQHRSASKYDSLEAACISAEAQMQRSQPFMVYNVLDSKKHVVASFKK